MDEICICICSLMHVQAYHSICRRYVCAQPLHRLKKPWISANTCIHLGTPAYNKISTKGVTQFRRLSLFAPGCSSSNVPMEIQLFLLVWHPQPIRILLLPQHPILFILLHLPVVVCRQRDTADENWKWMEQIIAWQGERLQTMGLWFRENICHICHIMLHICMPWHTCISDQILELSRFSFFSSTNNQIQF